MNPNPFAQMMATLAAKPRKRPEINRLNSGADMTEAETWDMAIARLLGPVVKTTDREQRRTNALALADAAIRAAGEDNIPTTTNTSIQQ